MTMKQAVGFNFLSACTCYVGFVAGEIIGETTSGTSWVLLLTAGMFLYIALVDMVSAVRGYTLPHRSVNTSFIDVFLFLLLPIYRSCVHRWYAIQCSVELLILLMPISPVSSYVIFHCLFRMHLNVVRLSQLDLSHFSRGLGFSLPSPSPTW